MERLPRWAIRATADGGNCKVEFAAVSRAHRSGSPDNHRIRGTTGNLYVERNRLLQLKVIVWSEIAASRCPAKLPMPAKEQVWEHLVSNSAVAGGLERYLIPSEEAPQEKAAAIRLVLTTRVPKVAFEDSCLRFANSIIEAGGGVYREKKRTLYQKNNREP